MGWLVFAIVILAYIAYKFFSDRNQMLVQKVDVFGGMRKKYKVLIDRFTNYPTAKIIKETRSHVQIYASGQSTGTSFLITQNFNSVQIEWIGHMGVLGIHRHNWSFQDNYPQEKMLQEIESYLEWKMTQMFGNHQ